MDLERDINIKDGKLMLTTTVNDQSNKLKLKKLIKNLRKGNWYETSSTSLNAEFTPNNEETNSFGFDFKCDDTSDKRTQYINSTIQIAQDHSIRCTRPDEFISINWFVEADLSVELMKQVDAILIMHGETEQGLWKLFNLVTKVKLSVVPEKTRPRMEKHGSYLGMYLNEWTTLNTRHLNFVSQGRFDGDIEMGMRFQCKPMQSVSELIELHKPRPLNPALWAHLRSLKSINDTMVDHFSNGVLRETMMKYEHYDNEMMPTYAHSNPLFQSISRTNIWPNNRVTIQNEDGWKWSDKNGNDHHFHDYGGFIQTSASQKTIFTRILSPDLCEQHLLSHLTFDWIMHKLTNEADPSYTEVSLTNLD